MSGMTSNTKQLIKALSENDIYQAKRCAIACLSEDETQKNADFVQKYKPILLNESSVIALPSNLKNKIEALDLSLTFRDDRYYKTNETLEISEEIRKMSIASDKLASMQIPYLNASLFYGESGTGKTMLAKYVAYKMGLPYLYLNFSQVINSYMGGTASSLNLVFEYVKRTPCVFTIDELDAVAVRRSQNSNQGSDGEMNRITITLLQELDNLPNNTILIACTNRIDRIDEALLSRFTQVREIKPLSMHEKEAMVSQYLDTLELGIYDRNKLIDSVKDESNQRKIINTLIKEYANIIIQKENQIGGE